MSRADELFSRYGSSGRVEVEGYDVSDLVRRKKKTGPKLGENLGSVVKLSQELEAPPESRELKVEPEYHEESKDSEIRLAFAFQSQGWAGTLMDRLNTFSYKDMYKRRIAKVKAKTADIKGRIDSIKIQGKSVEEHE